PGTRRGAYGMATRPPRASLSARSFTVAGTTGAMIAGATMRWVHATGWPLASSHRIVEPSIMARVFPDTVKNGLDKEAVEGGVAMPYAIPNVHVDYQLTDTGIPVGFWRSVNNSYNAFAVESFIDELAHAAKKDPYEYRRDLLGKAPRHLGVLNLAAS